MHPEMVFAAQRLNIPQSELRLPGHLQRDLQEGERPFTDVARAALRGLFRATKLTAKATAAASEQLGHGLADAGESLGHSGADTARHLWRNRRHYTAFGALAGLTAAVIGGIWLTRDLHLTETFRGLVGSLVGLPKSAEPVIEPGVDTAASLGGLGAATLVCVGATSLEMHGNHRRRRARKHARHMAAMWYDAGLAIIAARDEAQEPVRSAQLLAEIFENPELLEPSTTLYFASSRSQVPDEPYLPVATRTVDGLGSVYHTFPALEPAFA
ncbi:MAG TPA: hypothetical protein VLF40_06705 [Candidatus Saccharimonadales bacterium]|nr:hypothetical protein [Candidatus Saccharimonadales bacterium]